MKQLGVVVPIVTPCTSAGEPALEQLTLICNDMLAAGCHSLFPLGSTGRGPWFSRENQMKICKTVAQAKNPETPILAGCMAAGLDIMIQNAKAMADSGATIAVATAPMYFSYSTQELESIFLGFADASPIPIIIYDIPDMVAAKLTPQLLTKLATHQNVVGFKDSSANYENFKHLLTVLDAQVSDFYLLQGKEHLLKDSLQAGASGLVVSMLHVHPGPFVGLYNAVQENDTKTADRLQQAIIKIVDCCLTSFTKRPEMSTLFHFLNTALNERGLDVNITMDHEGQCPDWLADKAREALEIAKNASGE